MNSMLLVDYYKTHHQNMYPKNTSLIYSNFTPRKSRNPNIEGVVTFGIQHFILEYLIEHFNKNFFIFTKEERDTIGIQNKHILDLYKKGVMNEYKEVVKLDDYSHIENLWDLGYLPIEIKALEEGTICPIGVPMLTVVNTHKDFAWLTNYLETLISTSLWQGITSATIAHEYKKILSKYSMKTTGSVEGIEWQGHDFSMRGMSSVETTLSSGMGHLLSFTGTDSIPAIVQMKKSYPTESLIGASVPATEHSVMCMGTKDDEIGTFKALLDSYPTGILSVVSDTWDLWKVLTEYLPQLKEQILTRDGKLVIRPDSGDPVDIICGNSSALEDYRGYGLNHKSIGKGVVELLWDVFGGTINEQGYKVLDSHIGCIYGDGIGLHNLEEICSRLEAKGFASTNVVFGFGSYGYQYNTRDTFGFAMKATYGELQKECPNKTSCCEGESGDCENLIETREIFKDPITDDGTKKSKKGLLNVYNLVDHSGEFLKIEVKDQCTWEQESKGLLKTVFKDGKLVKSFTLDEIRDKLKESL